MDGTNAEEMSGLVTFFHRSEGRFRATERMEELYEDELDERLG